MKEYISLKLHVLYHIYFLLKLRSTKRPTISVNMYSFADILQHFFCLCCLNPRFSHVFSDYKKGAPGSNGLTYYHAQILPQILILVDILEAFPIRLHLK